jgi:hypothetical protein
VFAVGGTGEYRIRPIHIDDLARVCAEAGSSTATYVIDAVGPERPTFYELRGRRLPLVGGKPAC